jgi:hypothetical protein
MHDLFQIGEPSPKNQAFTDFMKLITLSGSTFTDDVRNNILTWYMEVTLRTHTPSEKSQEYALAFDRTVPELILASLNGFNGRLLHDSISGYRGNVNRFGTKWDVGNEVYCEGDTETRLTLSFSTAWSPSLPVTAALAEIFPDLEFEHVYVEPGCHFCGRASFYSLLSCDP